MNISYNWLKNYVDVDGISPQELSEILTNSGLEVEGLEKFESVKGGLEGIVIGKVLSCEKHPNADKLTLTKVDIKAGEPLSIVCGAPNVEAGQIVPVAIVGSTLHMGDDSFVIKKSKIRGELSEGMICAEDELGLGISHEGIMILDDDAEIGSLAKDYFNIDEDWVFEIGLTPNRTDATSHIGTARDIVATLNQQQNKNLKLSKPSVDDFTVDNHDLNIEIQVDDVKACPRYTGICISGIQVDESPDWLKNYLNAVDIRPINNIVDITNFVLMETGHPLHAFDAEKIKGNKVVIRKAVKDEKFVSLDEAERELLADDLMICDESDGMCIAGVFGGINSGINESTKNIFLESAYFDPAHIRATSKAHGLQTDASFRFERGADPNITEYALKRAAILFKEIAGGKISSEIVDVYPEKINNWEVKISLKRVNALIGKEIPESEVISILKDLEIDLIKKDGDMLLFSVPTYRYEVRREADIVEEILRIYGYNNIELSEKISSSISDIPNPDPEKTHELIANFLSDNGFLEIMNNSLSKTWYSENFPGFDPEEDVKLFNPLSNDLNVMRQSLLFGGLESVLYNQNRKSPDCRFYEFGTEYSKNKKFDDGDPLNRYNESIHLALTLSGRKQKESWNTTDDDSDIFFLKSFVDQIIKRSHFDSSALELDKKIPQYFSNGITYNYKGLPLAVTGEISKDILDKMDIKQKLYFANINWDILFSGIIKEDLKYKEIPKFPEVRRDLALVVDQKITFEEIKDIAIKSDRNIIKSVGLFDVYEGDKIEKGKKSYAISIILQDPRKTLTDKFVDKLISKIVKQLEEKLSATLR